MRAVTTLALDWVGVKWFWEDAAIKSRAMQIELLKIHSMNCSPLYQFYTVHIIIAASSH